MKSVWIKIKDLIGKICLVDRFLMLFMLILLLYTAVNLFTDTISSQDTNTIDVIIRTSSAAVFGYFVSSNFIKTNSSDTTQGQNISPEVLNVNTEKRIESAAFPDTAKTETETASIRESTTPVSVYYNKMQIAIVSVIGILSLILLFVAGKLCEITPETSATVSQLRDFISACVGFLVSCGKLR